jgi:glycosyltransferase involved in cell wall biosynthesis
VLAGAAALTTVAEPLAARLRATHSRPVHVISNGYDPDDVVAAPPRASRSFLISHTGTLYEGRGTPNTLLKAVRGLIDIGEVRPGSLQVRFYGGRQRWVDDLIATLGLTGVAQQDGRVDFAASVEAQRQSHVLLLLTSDDPVDRGTCPAKLFEYMAARRPVLAIGYLGSVASQVVAATEVGRAFSGDDEAGVRSYLQELLEEFRVTGTVACRGNRVAMEKYSQREMARQMAEVLNRCLGAGGVTGDGIGRSGSPEHDAGQAGTPLSAPS